MPSVHEVSNSPLTVILDRCGYGGIGSGLVDVWVKDAGNATFRVYGSTSNTKGSWRKLDTLTLPDGDDDEMVETYQTAFRYIGVRNTSETASEIEIVSAEG